VEHTHQTGIFPSVEYEAATDTEGTSVAGVSLWATEALEHFTGALKTQLGIPEDAVMVLNVPRINYTPGICAGSLAFRESGQVLNVGVWDGEDKGDRIVRPLIPAAV
jgi:hypothetical protein